MNERKTGLRMAKIALGFRKRHRLTQEEVALMAGVSIPTVSRFENGCGYTMQWDTIYHIADALDIHPFCLLDDEYPPISFEGKKLPEPYEVIVKSA